MAKQTYINISYPYKFSKLTFIFIHFCQGLEESDFSLKPEEAWNSLNVLITAPLTTNKSGWTLSSVMKAEMG